MDNKFIDRLYNAHQNTERLPDQSKICEFLMGVLELMFPEISEKRFTSKEGVEIQYKILETKLLEILGALNSKLKGDPGTLAHAFLGRLEEIYELLLKDADAIGEGDPAATDNSQVIRSYPGFFATATYRIAHVMCDLNIPILPRILTEYAHEKTGIDIHPGATIGERFCIDHGTGIVIGETTVVGRNVKIYQGVTLGALSVAKDMAKLKRHPTIEDDVVIYAGATILGGNTSIGNHSIIGGNVWITQSVPPFSRVYHSPQIKVRHSSDPSEPLNFVI